MTYRIVNKSLVVGGLIMVALIIAAHMRGMGVCGWRILTGGECIACGCTRDFFSILKLDFDFINPLSPFIFIVLLGELLFRLVASFATMRLGTVVVDSIIHGVLLLCIMCANFYKLMK